MLLGMITLNLNGALLGHVVHHTQLIVLGQLYSQLERGKLTDKQMD